MTEDRDSIKRFKYPYHIESAGFSDAEDEEECDFCSVEDVDLFDLVSELVLDVHTLTESVHDLALVVKQLAEAVLVKSEELENGN